MPIRKTTAERKRPREMTHADMVRAFRISLNDDFTDDALCEAFPSRRAAQRAWPSCRLAVWRQTHRMHLPRAAEVFDGLTRHGWDAIFWGWNHSTFPLVKALDAIEQDRRAVADFARREPKGAASIASCLAQWRTDLDTLEVIARELGADTRPSWQRPYPGPRMTTARSYDDPRPGALGMSEDR